MRKRYSHNKCIPITSFNNDVFEKIDLYEKSAMPDEGWFHSCVNCVLYTANTILFTRSFFLNKNCEFWMHLCNSCNKRISHGIKDYIIFSKKSSSMVRDYKIQNLKLNHQGHTDLDALPPVISNSYS